MRVVKERTMAEIEILKKSEPRNVVFIGKPGLNKLKLAKELVAGWLDTQEDALDLHPDYLYIEPSDGSIRTEQAELIRRKAQICPHGEKAVCLVNGAEAMSTDLQNKLLKVLEDSDKELAVVFVSTKDLLETVMSRCMAVRFWPMGLEEMHAYYQKPSVAALLASDGCPGIYDAILSDGDFLVYLEGFYQAMCGFREREQLKHLLRLTHSLKEKDREYLPEKFNSWELTAFLNLLKHLYWQIIMQQYDLPGYPWISVRKIKDCYRFDEAEACYYACLEAAEQSKSYFSKNDFFDLLMKLIPTA